MGYPEVIFVTALLLVGLYMTLMIRREFVDRELRQRQEQQRLEDERRRQTAERGNPRSVTRR